MVITETRFGTEDGGPGNPSLIKKGQNVVMEKLMAGADVRVQMNYDPQRPSNVQHPHSQETGKMCIRDSFTNKKHGMSVNPSPA